MSVGNNGSCQEVKLAFKEEDVGMTEVNQVREREGCSGGVSFKRVVLQLAVR